MKITSVRPVLVAFPKVTPPKGRKTNWHNYMPRGLPMNRFEDFPPDVPGKTPGFFRIFHMEQELSDMVGGRKVDLRTPKDLSRHFRDRVLATAVVQYAA